MSSAAGGPGSVPGRPLRTVVLVPRREGFADRDALWAWTRAWWGRELSRWPIVEGHHDVGLFNRSAAVNRAAAIAGPDWDVAVIIDADVICDPQKVMDAAELAHETGRMVLPFTVRKDLNQIGTKRVMAGYSGNWEPYVHRRYTDGCSSVVCVSRKLWDQVGGFDEAFEGWGWEDNAFRAACMTFAGADMITMDGEVWHLWHRTAKEGVRGTPSWAANQARSERYRTVIGDVDATRRLQEEGRALAAGTERTIPKILHRVVPEETHPQAEAWWQRFGELHPDWRLLTHRDPLDPAEWPLTSPYWDDCEAGAQLADLVRLEALLRWGGIYVDQDVQPFRPLDPLLGLEAFAAWEDERCIPNAVLGARRAHPAIKECLELAIKRLPKGIWKAGPGVTTQVLRNRSDVLVLPPGTFYPVHYNDPERDRKMRDFEVDEHPWTFALHQYWGSWLEEVRRRVPAA